MDYGPAAEPLAASAQGLRPVDGSTARENASLEARSRGDCRTKPAPVDGTPPAFRNFQVVRPVVTGRIAGRTLHGPGSAGGRCPRGT